MTIPSTIVKIIRNIKVGIVSSKNLTETSIGNTNACRRVLPRPIESIEVPSRQTETVCEPVTGQRIDNPFQAGIMRAFPVYGSTCSASVKPVVAE